MSDGTAVPDGIPCPNCSGTAWDVIKTALARGRIVRYRKCRGCLRVVRTREVFDASTRPHTRPRKARTN